MQRFIFCRVLDIRVAEIVDADLFHAAFPAAPLHLVVEIMLGHGENAALGVRFQPGGQPGAEELRQPDHPAAFGRFGWKEEILPMETGAAFCDGDRPRAQVKIRRFQGQELPRPHPRPEQEGEHQRRALLPLHCGQKAGELSRRPDAHFPGPGFPHGPRQAAGVGGQLKIIHRVVEEGAGLVVDGLEISGRKDPGIGEEGVLPAADVPRRDLAQGPRAEKGHQLVPDDALLGLHRGGAQAHPAVLQIELRQVTKPHPAAPGAPGEKGPLELLSLVLGAEALLFLLAAGAVGVGEIELADPAPAGLFLKNRHDAPPFFRMIAQGKRENQPRERTAGVPFFRRFFAIFPGCIIK